MSLSDLEKEVDRLRLKCIGCGKCTEVCPSYRHGGIDPKEIMIGGDENLLDCIGCGNCSKVCRRTDPFIAIKDLIAIETQAHLSDSFRANGTAIPIQPMESPEPVWDGDEVTVMSGCVVRCKAPFLEYAASVAIRSAGSSCRKMRNETCCMHPTQFRELTEMERRSYKGAMGEDAEGSRLVTLCGGCDEEFAKSGIQSEHMIRFLHSKMDSLPKFDEPIKVAIEPGCSTMDLKKEMREVVAALGCEPVDNKMGCCGKNIRLSGEMMEAREAECAKADLIVVGCPMCFTKYDAQPNGKPVVYIAELVAMAAGDRASLKHHCIPVDF